MTGLFQQFSKEFQRLIHEFQLPFENSILTFSILLFIILLSPMILRRFKIPALIGMIIAGVIIGPNGLGVISKANMDGGFVNMFSKIGLLYIMFIAGLELDLQDFKRHKNKSFAFGALTFLIPLIVGYFVCEHLLKLNSVASLLTASMFATHTLVAYPIVTKFGLSKMEAVAIAVGATILTDTAVLIILAVISSSGNGDINTNVLIHLSITLTIFSIIMFWIIPKLSRWFFRKLEEEKGSQYIYVLSVLFFAAFLAEVAGIEAIIGAFVAGLVMNSLIPHSSTLMNRVEFVGNALFIPFFLISIGMVVDITVLADNPWAWAVAGILTAVALSTKFIAALITQFLFNLKATERNVIFGLSSAHAAATLAVINVGYEMKILDIEIVNGTVILILLTSMVASFVTESASRKIVLTQQNQTSGFEDDTSTENNILVALNTLKGNEKLLDFSILMHDKHTNNKLSVVSVIESDDDAEVKLATAPKHLSEISAYYTSGEIHVDTNYTLDNNTENAIGRVSKELFSDIVLINDHSKSNLLKRIIGDDRELLLDVCDKTIFFCRLEKSFTDYRKIVLTCPPYSELQPNSRIWGNYVFKIARELNLKIEFYSTKETFARFEAYKNSKKYGTEISHVELTSPEDIMDYLHEFDASSLVINVFARQGSISAFLGMDSLPQRIEREITKIDRVFIYPSKLSAGSYNSYDDMTANPLSAGMETIQRISKEVGGIFKKNTDEK